MKRDPYVMELEHLLRTIRAERDRLLEWKRIAMAVDAALGKIVERVIAEAHKAER